MQGRIAGFFMTMILALPLAAIPLMAIFGIPQFGSLASTLDETGFLLENPSSETAAPAWDAEPAPAFDADATGDAVNVAEASGDEQTPFFESSDPAFQSSPTQPVRLTQTASLDVPTAAGSQSLDWDQSLAKLAEFGISDYRLQPGVTQGQFHFACYSKQNQSGGTVIRFEAEAGNPLDAIHQALQQVTEWHQAGNDSVISQM